MSKITDSDLITEDKVDFVLAEAKEQLNATVADAEALTKTGVYLLGGLLTVITALVGVTGTQFNGSKSLSDQRWGLIIPLVLTKFYPAADAAIIISHALSSTK